MNALTFAKLSAVVYCDIEISKLVDVEDYELKVFDKDTELAYMDLGNNEIAFVYRGSSSVIDWQYNLKFGLKSYKYASSEFGNAKVHWGILQKYNITHDFVCEKIMSKPGCKVYFAGHSLGGGLALMAGLSIKLSSAPCNVDFVYAYGAPRIGNSDFCDLYNRHLFSVTYSYATPKDLVPRLPPKLFGYRSVGKQVSVDCDLGWISSHLPRSYIKGLG